MTKLKNILICFYLIFICYEVIAKIDSSKQIKAEVNHDSEKNITRIKLDKNSTDLLFKQWQDQAISGLMAGIASIKIEKVSKDIADSHEKCAKEADTVAKHAACVSELLKAPDVIKSPKKSMDMKERLAKLKPEKIHQPIDPLKTTDMPKTTVSKNDDEISTKSPFKFEEDEKIIFSTKHDQNSHDIPPKKYAKYNNQFSSFKKQKFRNLQNIPGFSKQSYLKNMFTGAHSLNFDANQFYQRNQTFRRMQRHETVQKIAGFALESRKKRYATKSEDDFALLPSQHRLTPIGWVAKNVLGKVMELKDKKQYTPWQKTVGMARETSIKRKEIRRRAKARDEEFRESMGFRGMDNRIDPEDMMDLLDEKVDKKQFVKGWKKDSKDPTVKMMGFLRQGMKLVNSVFGKNVSNFEERNMKVMSPRFFSVMPEDKGDDGEDDDPIDVLSPSILSLHPSGEGLEKQLSLPNLVKGFSTADQQAWLDLIFEAANVKETIEEATKKLTEEEFQLKRKKRYEDVMRNDKGEPLYFTKEKAVDVGGEKMNQSIEIFEKLIKSYSDQQMKQINETGYAILTKKQLELVYGKDSPYHNPIMIKQYSNMTAEEIHKQLIHEIHDLAKNKEFQQRQKDIVLSPTMFTSFIFKGNVTSQPLILSPLLFVTIVGSPIILGPTILGPWMFLPLIMSPRIVSPAILDPFMFVPVIMSPLVLHPIILSPGLFNPFVLTPCVMVPIILSPQVFTPLILCPLVLSPFILSPGVGGPLVLSPFVLTPVIWNPLALFALVLSPNALSPVIQSKLYLAEIILSPSWLS